MISSQHGARRSTRTWGIALVATAARRASPTASPRSSAALLTPWAPQEGTRREQPPTVLDPVAAIAPPRGRAGAPGAPGAGVPACVGKLGAMGDLGSRSCSWPGSSSSTIFHVDPLHRARPDRRVALPHDRHRRAPTRAVAALDHASRHDPPRRRPRPRRGHRRPRSCARSSSTCADRSSRPSCRSRWCCARCRSSR